MNEDPAADHRLARAEPPDPAGFSSQEWSPHDQICKQNEARTEGGCFSLQEWSPHDQICKQFTITPRGRRFSLQMWSSHDHIGKENEDDRSVSRPSG